MKKTIVLLIMMLVGFWLVFTGLQNPKISSNTLGLVADNWHMENGDRLLIDKPYIELTNKNYVQWDAKHYHRIKSHGYDIEQAGGDYVFAFFPLFPLIWSISSLPPIGILFLNYLFFSASVLLLLRAFSDNKNYLQNTIISLCLPSLIIFFIPYSEASFMLFISIGTYGFVKHKYWLFFTGILLASLVRPSYIFLLLSIFGVELFFFIRHRNFNLALKNTISRVLPLILGTTAVSFYQYTQNSGSFFKFIEVQKYWQNILGIPHNLRDWSHEGFAINIGVIFLIAIPLLIIVLQLFIGQLRKKNSFLSLDYSSSKDYFFLLSLIYVLGNALFIVMFRGGSLHCLFRFTLSSPFFFILLYTSFDYIRKTSFNFRFFIISSLALMSLFVLGLADYSTYWNFSDLGIFIFISALTLWIFQDLKSNRIYQFGSYMLLIINLFWTTYLFNTYIIDGWIFA